MGARGEWILRSDPVEVFLQVQRKFGVTIGWNEFEKITKMGDLHSLVLDKVGRRRPQHVCVSSATFYRLRRVLGDLFGVPREYVGTTSPLEDFVPLQDREQHWQRLCAALAVEGLSSVRPPGWTDSLPLMAWATCIAMVFLLGVELYQSGVSPLLSANLVAIGIALSFLVAWACYRLRNHLKTRIPPSVKTVRDMVYSMVGHGQERLVSDEHRPSDAETWSVLCGIVGDEFDVQPSSLTLASHPWSP
jgi:hypothetical protein